MNSKTLTLSILTLIIFNELQSMENSNTNKTYNPETIYSPWRTSYVYKAPQPNVKLKNDCPFCDQISQNNDEKYKIVRYNETFFLMVNANPNALEGSFLIIPTDHLAYINSLDKTLRLELAKLLKSLTLMLDHLGYKNYPIGLNRGKNSGASIPDHIHFHVTPFRNIEKSNKFDDLRKAVKFFKEHKNITHEAELLYKELKENINQEYKEKFEFNDLENHKCAFCKLVKNTDQDEENLVIIRLKSCMLIFNSKPLVQGQMIIIPFQHAKNLFLLSDNILCEVLDLCAQLEDISPKLLKNTAHNVIVNIGEQPNGRPNDHITFDFWPRWDNDFGHMLLANKQIISYDIPKMIESFKKELEDKQIKDIL